jgi:hypothetical protein
MQRLQRTGSFTSEAEVFMGEFVLVFLEKRNTRRANNIFAALCVYVLSPSVDNPGIQPENDDKARKIEYQKHAPYCINSRKNRKGGLTGYFRQSALAYFLLL